MGNRGAIAVISRQDFLNPLEEGLSRGVQKAFEAAGPTGDRVRNFLHGTWLGEPLHAALTDVPIGAWTAAVICDALDAVTGRDRFRAAADACIGVGIAGAAAAAIAGLTDWHKTDPPARRIGLVHGLLNTGTLSLFATSLGVRRRSRPLGRGLAAAGLLLGAFAAHLGGELVYGQKIGVDHTAGAEGPEDWVAVMPEAELAERQPRRADAAGIPVVLVRRGDRIRALFATCSHLGGPLDEGKLDGEAIECPWHASRFSLADGRVLNGPAVHPQPCLEARARFGHIEVRRASAASPQTPSQSAPASPGTPS